MEAKNKLEVTLYSNGPEWRWKLMTKCAVVVSQTRQTSEKNCLISFRQWCKQNMQEKEYGFKFRDVQNINTIAI